MAEKQSFVMHMMWAEIFEKLPTEKAGELIQAIYAYQKTGEASVEDPVLSAVFEMIRSKMEDDAEKYWTQVERNRKNGHKGGRPRKTHNNPEKPNGFLENPLGGQQNPQKPDTDTDTDTDTVTDIDTVSNSSNEEIVSLSSNDDNSSAKPTREHVPYQEVVEKFNEICLSLPQVQKLTPARRQAIKGRCSEYSVPEIVDVFRRAENSDFLSGRNGNWNGCSFDWLMKPANFIKVLEGNYENQPAINQHSKINGHDELNEFYAMTARWAEGDSSG